MTDPDALAPAACREATSPIALADEGSPRPLSPVQIGGAPFPLLAPGGWFPAVSAAASNAALAGDAYGGDRIEAAGVAFLAGDLAAAESGWTAAAEAGAEAPGAAEARLGLALVAALRGEPAKAAVQMEAVERSHGPDDPLHVLARLNRAAALAAAGRPADGEAAAAEALRASRRIKSPGLEAAASFAFALCALARGRRNTARTRLGEALRGFTRLGDRLRMIQCHHLLGEIAYEAEDPIKAGSHYRDGLGIARAANAIAAVELLMLRFEHR
jgi:tetratricopeptide (TPR) repeat protein